MPEASVAVTFTVVCPTGNLVLGALSYTILTELKISLSVADASNSTIGSSCYISYGHINSGAMISGQIVTSKVHDHLILIILLAWTLTLVVWPYGKKDFDSCVDTNLNPGATII